MKGVLLFLNDDDCVKQFVSLNRWCLFCEEYKLVLRFVLICVYFGEG